MYCSSDPRYEPLERYPAHRARTEARTPRAPTAAEITDSLTREATTAERARIGGLTELATAFGVRPERLDHAILSGQTTDAFALQITDPAVIADDLAGDIVASAELVSNQAGAPSLAGANSGASTVDALAQEISAIADLASSGAD